MASKKKAHARLTRAIGEQHMVRIERTPKFADRLNGFVVAVGDEWAVIAQSSDGGFFDGHLAFRLRDVKRIRRDKTFETTFAKTQPEWPPTPPDEVGLNSTSEVIDGLPHGGVLIGIQKDNEWEAIWIGKLDELWKRVVYLHEVRPDATWHPAPLGYKLKAITTVEVGTRYLQGLAAIAGDGPDRAES
ncbi:MAG: hypothetical protein JF592_18925 [Microbacterium sp.]|uniref:hypothetical protein n=1 Tax=Microbacterium sp. TaxID=51671 RepID=UPI001D3D1CF7|nr:hypothetical protein [Microbacterium sp.]MBW8764622.1 hypothetical protein [Microbacterium sp.]